jgi:predicted enzyme related to lactoylglutathione lyase
MPDIDRHAPGTLSWADLSTKGAGAAKDFYTGVFGWDAVDLPIPGGGVYTMFQMRGRSVAAVSEQQDQEAAQGIPPHWTTYITVADVDAAAKQAEAAGATLLAPPFDVMDAGRMAVIADPTGAAVALWQAGTSIGAEITHEPNALGWFELMTPDVEKAKAFYSGLFGWTAEEVAMPTGTYTLMTNEDPPAQAGFMAPPAEAAGMPPNWGVYFDVADCRATAARIAELGGRILMEPTAVEMAGVLAAVVDPQGAYFSVIEPAPAPAD